MTNENVFDILEICFQSLEQGADVESCLARFPELADDLRPALIAAVQLRSAPAVKVPAEVARRGRARVLQAAAEMRESNSTAPVLPFRAKKGFFGARLYRLTATAAVMVAFLLSGGTGLVYASNGALPGDHLYTVKRGWENIRLVFVFDPKTKINLEHQFDHERVTEIEELYSVKRIAPVNFQGIIQSQQSGIWVIDGLNVSVGHETNVSGEFLIGTTVQVMGETEDGRVKANQIILIATPGVTLQPSVGEPTGTPTFTPTSESAASGIEIPESSNTPGSVGSSEDGDQVSKSPSDSPSDSNFSSPTKREGGGENENYPTLTPTPGKGSNGSLENGDWRKTDHERHPTQTATPKGD